MKQRSRQWFRLSVALALAIAILPGCKEKASWTEYQHPGGRLTISFPTADTPTGDGTGHALSTVWNNITYTVSWVDIPDWSEEEYRRELESNARRQGTVNSSARVAHAGLDGMEFNISDASGAAAFSRYLRKDNRVYVLRLEGPKLDPAAPAPQQFLASFRAE